MAKTGRVFILIGPTGSGKTSLVRGLGPDWEIISVDSRQIYRYNPVAACSPTAEDRRRHRYHMVEALEPDQRFSIWQFALQAADLINEIHQRGHHAALVGGTGLYFKSLLEGLDEWTLTEEGREEADRAIRKDETQPGYAFELLARYEEPQMHPNDRYRLRKRLEWVFSGQPAATRKHFYDWSQASLMLIQLDKERRLLYEQIDRRIGGLFEAGVIEEYRQLKKMGYKLTDPGLQSLGYDWIDKYDQNQIDFKALSFKLGQSHRRYAKKQITFFKSQLLQKRDILGDPKQIIKKIENWEI